MLVEEDHLVPVDVAFTPRQEREREREREREME